jgi:hypothetical protein
VQPIVRLDDRVVIGRTTLAQADLAMLWTKKHARGSVTVTTAGQSDPRSP